MAPTKPSHTTEISAARLFWDQQMEKHPQLHGVLSILASVFGYVFNGHIVLGAAKWAITVGGRIATSILFFAALWVAGRSTEPTSLAHLLNYLPFLSVTAPQVDHVAILSFTLLPEILLLGAGLTTIEQWVGVKRQGGLYWIWALIYSPLTLMFLGIAIYTFISFLANGSASVVISASGKADGATLIRAPTGWSYALLELLHAGVGARYSNAAPEATPVVPPIDIQATISQAIGELAAQLQDDQARLFEELAKKQEHHLGQMDLLQQQRLLTAIQEVKESVPTIDHDTLIEVVSATCETHLQAKIEALLSQCVTVSPVSETLKIAGPRNVSPTPKRNPRAGKATLTTRAKTEFEGDPETVVCRLLDEDGSRTHRTIAKMTGIPDTTVYRIRKRYLEEQGNSVSSEPGENETAM